MLHKSKISEDDHHSKVCHVFQIMRCESASNEMRFVQMKNLLHKATCTFFIVGHYSSCECDFLLLMTNT